MLFETEDFTESKCENISCFKASLTKSNILNEANLEYKIEFYNENGFVPNARGGERPILKGSVKVSVIVSNWAFCSNPEEKMCLDREGKLFENYNLAAKFAVESGYPYSDIGFYDFFLGDSYMSIGTTYNDKESDITKLKFIVNAMDIENPGVDALIIYQKNLDSF